MVNCFVKDFIVVFIKRNLINKRFLYLFLYYFKQLYVTTDFYKKKFEILYFYNSILLSLNNF
jgi:hypothetical protein